MKTISQSQIKAVEQLNNALAIQLTMAKKYRNLLGTIFEAKTEVLLAADANIHEIEVQIENVKNIHG